MTARTRTKLYLAMSPTDVTPPGGHHVLSRCSSRAVSVIIPCASQHCVYRCTPEQTDFLYPKDTGTYPCFLSFSCHDWLPDIPLPPSPQQCSHVPSFLDTRFSPLQAAFGCPLEHHVHDEPPTQMRGKGIQCTQRKRTTTQKASRTQQGRPYST